MRVVQRNGSEQNFRSDNNAFISLNHTNISGRYQMLYNNLRKSVIANLANNAIYNAMTLNISLIMGFFESLFLIHQDVYHDLFVCS